MYAGPGKKVQFSDTVLVECCFWYKYAQLYWVSEKKHFWKYLFQQIKGYKKNYLLYISFYKEIGFQIVKIY